MASKAKEVFQHFDFKGTGKLVKSRIALAVRSTGLAASNAEISAAISSEFEGIVKQLEAIPRPSTDSLAATAGKVFGSSDGTLSMSDLRGALEHIGEQLTEEEIDELLQHAELDKHGNIVLKSFASLLTPPQ